MMWEGRISDPKKELSSLEMTLSLNPQGFAQSPIGERRLPLMPYKPLAMDECTTHPTNEFYVKFVYIVIINKVSIQHMWIFVYIVVGLRAQNHALGFGFVRGRWMIRGGTNSY